MTKRFLMVAFAVLTLCIVFLFWHNSMLTVALLVVLHASTLLYLKTRRYFFGYLFGFVLGPVSEILLIHRGAWAYTEPGLFGVPLWLPFLWGAAVVTAGFFFMIRTPYE